MFDETKILLVQFIASQKRLTLLLFQAQNACTPDAGKTLAGRTADYNVNGIAVESIHDCRGVLDSGNIGADYSGRDVRGKRFTGIFLMIQRHSHGKARLDEALAHCSCSREEIDNFRNRRIFQTLMPQLIFFGISQTGRQLYTCSLEAWKIFTAYQVGRAVTTTSRHLITP